MFMGRDLGEQQWESPDSALSNRPDSSLSGGPLPLLAAQKLRFEHGGDRDYPALILLLDRPPMAQAEPLITTVSTKGEVILPEAIQQKRHWGAGTRLIVEETPQGVLLKQAPAFSSTKPNDVFGMLPYSETPKSLEDMETGILAEARRRHGRD